MPRNVLITSDCIGDHDTELGRVLMRNFIYSLARAETPPAVVMFANEGVRLTCEGSEVIEDLRMLADAGVAVRACGTCLDFLKLTDKLLVGEVGTMPGLVGALLGDLETVTVG